MTVPVLLISMIAGIVFGLIGGTLAGRILAGKDLGNSFASMMGVLFSATAVIPGVILGTIILFLIF